MLLQTSAVARLLGVEPRGLDAVFSSVSFDSRTLRPGEMFVAVRGERDGHDFVADAIARGASVVLCERPLASAGAANWSSVTQLVVDDAVEALARIASWCRQQLEPVVDGRVVGITGSVGKTSTKDLLVAAIEPALAPVAASHKSFNNDLGVPVTIIGAPEGTRAMVLEMGMRGFGEIARLCEVARPHVGIVTAVADAHSEYVGGIDGVARAKAELVQSLPSGGTAVLNADDPRVASMASMTEARVVTYGAAGAVSFEVTGTDDEGRCTIGLRVSADLAPGGWQGTMRVPVPGRHMASNAAGALAAAVALGVAPDVAVAGIGRVEMSPARMSWRAGVGGARILDDSYNANPASMLAALETLAAVPATRRVAVLGLMAELAEPAASHRLVAERAGALSIEIVAVGTDLYGVPAVDVDVVADVVRALGLDAGVALLVKGSRVARLEKVVSALAVD